MSAQQYVEVGSEERELCVLLNEGLCYAHCGWVIIYEISTVSDNLLYVCNVAYLT